MEDTLNAMLLRTLPDSPKKPRRSNSSAKKVVKNSVKAKTTKISGEQGFRNYLKYTDPLLQESDETTDKSKLADDIEKIINLVKPAENIEKSAQKFLRNEPIDRGDILSEIKPVKLAFTPKKKPLIDEISSSAKPSKKSEKETEEKIKNKSATAIQSALRASKAKKEVKNLKEEKQKELAEFENMMNTKRATRNASATTLQAQVRRKIEAVELKKKKNSEKFDARVLNTGRPKKIKGAKYNETP